jgi:hypothetical protein
MKKVKDEQKTIITKHIMALGYNGLTKLPNKLVPSRPTPNFHQPMNSQQDPMHP